MLYDEMLEVPSKEHGLESHECG